MKKGLIFTIITLLSFGGFGQRISGTVNTSLKNNPESRTLNVLPAGLIFYEGFDNVTTPNLPVGWSTFSAGPSGFKTGTSGNSTGQANENGFWPVPLHGLFAMTNDDVCNCNKSADVLVSKTFDFSKLNYARLGLSIFQNGSNGQTAKIQIIHSDTIWTDLYNIPSSTIWEEYSIDIPKTFLRKNFQFRIRYSDNNGYASGVALDDIFISSSPTENFELEEFYTINLALANSAFLPSMIPETQARSAHLTFSALIENHSSKTKNALLSVVASGPLNYSDTSSNWHLASVSTDTIALPIRSTFTPFDSGEYSIQAKLLTDSVDLDPNDNSFEQTFEVNDSIYKWITEQTDGTGIWMVSAFDRLGSTFQVYKEDTITSAWVGVHPTTEVGARFRVKIFSFNTLTASIFSSSPVQIQEGDLDKKIRVPIGTNLLPGKYLFVVEVETGRLVVTTTAAVKSPQGISYYKTFNQNWRNLSYYPDISVVFPSVNSECPGHIQAEIQDEICFGEDNGAIKIDAIGTTIFSSNVWSNGAGDVDSLIDLEPGFYQVFVTDGNCNYDRLFEILPSKKLILTPQIIADSCSKGVGQLKLNSNSTHPPFTYKVNDILSPPNISGLDAGTYEISIDNSEGCSADTTIQLIGTDPIIISINTQPSGCGNANGKISSNVLGSAPFQYQWNTGDSISALEEINSGIYKLIVSDSIGCEQEVTVLLADSNAPDVSLIELIDNSCANESMGSIEVSSNGGSTINYSWSNGDTTSLLTGLTASTYELTVSDTNGCRSFARYIISDLSNPLGLDFIETGINCFGSENGGLMALIQGGEAPYTYVWSNNASGPKEISDLGPGVYSLTVSDNKNCQQSATTTIISQPQFFLVLDSLVSDTIPNDTFSGGIYLSAFGGTPPYRYAWNNGTDHEDLTGIDTGFFQVSITDQFGCALSYEKYFSSDPLSAKSLNDNPDLSIFPNPALKGSPIGIQSRLPIRSVYVYNLAGQIIQSTFENNSLFIEDTGVFIIQLHLPNGNITTQKVIIQ